MATISDVLEFYITACEADERSPRTLRDYERVLGPFAAWYDSEGFDTVSLDRNTVRHYVVLLQRRGWPSGTVSMYIRYIQAFLNWLYYEDHTEANLAKALKAPKSVVRDEEPLLEEELLILEEACEKGRYPDRDQALLWFFVDTGMRLGEMASLQRDQIHFNEKTAWLQIYATKTKTVRYIILGETTTQALRIYLGGRDDDEPALWIGRNGPLTDRAIYQLVKRRARDVGMGL